MSKRKVLTGVILVTLLPVASAMAGDLSHKKNHDPKHEIMVEPRKPVTLIAGGEWGRTELLYDRSPFMDLEGQFRQPEASPIQ